MDKFKKRELYLFHKAQRMAKELTACVHIDDPINRQIIYKAYTLLWELGYTYRSEQSSYYVPKSSLEKELRRVDALECQIVRGLYKDGANQAIADCREYIDLAIAYRVRNSKKNRVY